MKGLSEESFFDTSEDYERLFSLAVEQHKSVLCFVTFANSSGRDTLITKGLGFVGAVAFDGKADYLDFCQCTDLRFVEPVQTIVSHKNFPR